MLIRILCLSFTLAWSGVSLAAPKLAAPEVVKVNDRIYAMLGPVGMPDAHNQGYMVNTVAIIGDKGVILVDTGFSDEIGRHLKAAIKKVSDKPITHVINTHHHGDHVLGNSEFKGAEILSTEYCRDTVDKNGWNWVGILESMVGRKFPNTKPLTPTATVAQESRTERTIHGVKMVIWAPPGSHTPGDLMVHLPEDKVLIAGDIIVSRMTPNLGDGNVNNWIEVLSEVKAMDLKTVIPGHGPLMSTQDVAVMHTRMVEFYAGVEKGYKDGLMDSEIRKTLDLSEWEKMVNFNELMGVNINRAFLEAEQRNF